MKSRVISLAATVVAVGASAMIAGCGADADEGGGAPEPSVPVEAGASEEAQQAALDFAECMREQGIDVPDPEPGSAGFAIDMSSDIDPTSPAFRAAEEECRHFLEEAAGDSGIAPVTEIPQEALDFAQCMRDRGLDWPDPRVRNGRLEIGPGDPGTAVDDPAVEAAAEECRDSLPEAPAPAP